MSNFPITPYFFSKIGIYQEILEINGGSIKIKKMETLLLKLNPVRNNHAN